MKNSTKIDKNATLQNFNLDYQRKSGFKKREKIIYFRTKGRNEIFFHPRVNITNRGEAEVCWPEGNQKWVSTWGANKILYLEIIVRYKAICEMW